MTLYVDAPQWPAHGRHFAHLISDRSYDELHAFAAEVGLHPRSYDGDHYDVPQERHADVVAAGARLVDGREVVRLLHATGLRFRKRKGERPMGRYPDVVPTVAGPHHLDVIVSDQEPPEPTTSAAATFVFDRSDRLLMVHSRARGGWEAPAGAREPGETPRAGAVREVREETGFDLDEALLRPIGYERITQSRPSPRWPHLPHCHVAIYAADLDVDGPSLTPYRTEVHDAVWVPLDQVPEHCSAQFWWPVLDWFLQQR
ncbi:DUF4031 domain-containing protein [Arsenicicoccus bolidensis]|uniref:DUF4031 domain-containing protein n=1 Tax=Arsenicicoccus bolidensis TaxID=229480 RepID=UPI000424419E|nr:DUF4031 domain-containing protein [Arsenicicoccus bolidensis]